MRSVSLGFRSSAQPAQRCGAFLCLAWLTGLVALSSSPSARADQFLLANGGQLQGKRVDDAKDAAAPYIIALDSGGTVTLEARQIREWRRPHPAQAEYERRVRETPHTAEAQWELAEWCRQHGLHEAREAHLLLILQLDTDHREARHALGYSQVGGQWVHPRRHHEEAGYVRYQGKWRTPQEVQLIQEREDRENAARQWRRQLQRWRSDLVSSRPERARAAYDAFQQIDDPHAIDPLTALILSEPLRPLKILFVRCLAAIPHDRAVHQLIYVSLTEPDIEVFHECIDLVVDRRSPETVPTYIQALRNIHNVRVNRAAYALRKLNDPQAIGPLIEALQTRHMVVLEPAKQPGQTTTTFVRPNNAAAQKVMDAAANNLQGSAFSTGDEPVSTYVTVPNQHVLQALVDMSGVSFGYDQAAWRRWHAAQRHQRPSSIASRRDEQ